MLEGLAGEQPKHLRNLPPWPPLPAPRCRLPSEAIKGLGYSSRKHWAPLQHILEWQRALEARKYEGLPLLTAPAQDWATGPRRSEHFIFLFISLETATLQQPGIFLYLGVQGLMLAALGGLGCLLGGPFTREVLGTAAPCLHHFTCSMRTDTPHPDLSLRI